MTEWKLDLIISSESLRKDQHNIHNVLFFFRHQYTVRDQREKDFDNRKKTKTRVRIGVEQKEALFHCWYPKKIRWK